MSFFTEFDSPVYKFLLLGLGKQSFLGEFKIPVYWHGYSNIF